MRDANVALTADEILHTPLRRPGHYLTRDGLPAVDTWLPQEDLFRIPRTPATEGVRGIGRLALCDHYHVVVPTHPHGARAVPEGGWPRRGRPPDAPGHRFELAARIYVATSLSGGTGSGMFLDLTYLIRREVRRLGFGGPEMPSGSWACPPFRPAPATARGWQTRGPR